MLIISYDIQNDKLRAQFSKYLKKFGYRLQFSVYEIRNSPRLLANIQYEINNRFEKAFGETDSIIIFQLGETCKKTCYGYQSHADTDFLFIE